MKSFHDLQIQSIYSSPDVIKGISNAIDGKIGLMKILQDMLKADLFKKELDPATKLEIYFQLNMIARQLDYCKEMLNTNEGATAEAVQ